MCKAIVKFIKDFTDDTKYITFKIVVILLILIIGMQLDYRL